MKKILLIYFFAFCGCLGFCPDSQAKILEKNVWAGMYCNWSLSDDGVMVIKGTGKMELQEDMLDVYKDKIKKIEEKTFYKCNKLEELVIPDSVEVIEKNAVYQCKALKKVKCCL